MCEIPIGFKLRLIIQSMPKWPHLAYGFLMHFVLVLHMKKTEKFFNGCVTG